MTKSRHFKLWPVEYAQIGAIWFLSIGKFEVCGLGRAFNVSVKCPDGKIQGH